MDDHSPPTTCPATQPVLRNEWYVVAFSHEVAGLRARRKLAELVQRNRSSTAPSEA